MTDEVHESLRVAAPRADLEDQRVRATVASRLFGDESVHRIGRFEVLGRLGAGANGVVYEAHDPKLERKVALKVVAVGPGGGGGSSGESLGPRSAEILREARAVARLDHPNIVAVYDAGVEGEHLWIAMELVEGGTLRTWCERASPGWGDVVRVFLAIADGLAAAHEAGLVHRDFKPDNVLLGRMDGRGPLRPRIVDFGLASGAGESPAARGESRAGELTATSRSERLDPQATPVSRGGAWVGTPGYMAPEQFEGGASGPATDQFAFFVALFETLQGIRPFAGDSVVALHESVRAGTLRPFRRRCPRWLRTAIVRGLDRDPARRWPSMVAVADHLRRRMNARARRPWLVGVGVVAAGLGATASLMSRSDPCAHAADDLAAVWSSERRAELTQRLRQLAPPGDDGFVERAVGGVDAWTARWSAARISTCESEVGGRTSKRVADLKVACHGEQLEILGGMLAGFDELETTKPDAFVRIIPAIASLPSVAACDDAEVLRRRASAALDPSRGATDPAQAEARASLQRDLARLEGRVAAGAGEQVAATLDELQARAEALEFPAALARVMRLRAGQAQHAGDHAQAMALASRALELAIAARDDLEASRASLHLLWVSGELMRDPETAGWWRGIADAYLESLGDPPRGRVEWLENTAVVDIQAGDHEAAIEALERALALRDADETLASGRYKTLTDLASAYSRRGEFKRAATFNQQAMDAIESGLGPSHPAMAMVMSNQGSYLHRQGDKDQAKAWLEKALALKEEIYGSEHPQLISTLNNLGPLVPPAQARAYYERAIEIGKASHGEDSPRIANATFNLALTLHDLEDHEAARRNFVRFGEIMRAAYGDAHDAVWSAQVAVAAERVHLGEARAGLAQLEGLAARLEQPEPPGAYDTSDYWVQVTRARAAVGDEAGAERAATRARADCGEIPDFADCLPEDVAARFDDDDDDDGRK